MPGVGAGSFGATGGRSPGLDVKQVESERVYSCKFASIFPENPKSLILIESKMLLDLNDVR